MAKKKISAKTEKWKFGAGIVTISKKGKTKTIKNGNTVIFKSTSEDEFEKFWKAFMKAKKYLYIVKE